jgi:hypothetical protein
MNVTNWYQSMKVLSGMTQPGWLGTLQYGIRAHGFNTEPGWATNVEFEVKIPQRN